MYLYNLIQTMTSITRDERMRELQWARHDNFVRCCEGSPRLEAIAVAFRDENHLSLGKLLMAATETHYLCNRALNSRLTTLFACYVGSEKLTRQQQDALNCELSLDERLLLISFLACEQFCVLKQGVQ